ncbi:slowpoke-binding protein isoform X2 [Rhipicephalus sanguineus]|uniref:slowpoke-binding protein isoform X2 n=1 Tax=Rhipicephalus sanguineus TaxID=34632 RepID=UPI0018944431|nr:slowpoke-binding protein isoform X2 [Rhipicephalus sanguineus]
MTFKWDDFAREYYWVILLAIFAVMALAAIAIWAILRCRYPRHEYLALDNESSFISDRLELSRKLRGDIDRNEALINCQYYLRGSTRYFLRYQLCNIGSRMDRHWFVVRDSATRTERLLTVTALPDACPLRHSPCQVRPGLQEIFLDLQHPYVHPVLDIDIKVLAERPHVVVVSPLNDVGSLKDLIYHSKYNEDWQEKYRPQGTGLPQDQVQRLAKQIVEGLLFLHEKDFPAFYNLHLGNVILQNGVARLTGLENVLLGYVPRVSAFIRKRICEDKEVVDAVCFGHALFEMAAGYEMSTTKPTDKNYADVEHCPEVYQVLRFIFENENHHYPTLEEVATLDFFRNIDLRELTTHTVPPILRTNLSSTAKHLLRDVQRFYRHKGKLKTSRSISVSSCDGGESSDSEKAGLLPRGVRAKRRPPMSPSQAPLVLKKPCPPPPCSSELLSPPHGSSSSPPPEFSSSPPQAETPPPEGTSTCPPSKASDTSPVDTEAPPPLDVTHHDPEGEPHQNDVAVTNFVTPLVETPPPKVPPRPPVWVQSQSSVSTCGSVEFCTPPSSPRIDDAEWCSSECIT